MNGGIGIALVLLLTYNILPGNIIISLSDFIAEEHAQQMMGYAVLLIIFVS